MPSDASTVGPQALPVPVGVALSSLDDPIAATMLDFFGFWLNWALDDKLADLDGGASATASPVANRFPIDPATVFVRQGVPALYCWSTGRAKLERFTTIQSSRKRTFRLVWLYDELVSPGGRVSRNGLLQAADAAICEAFDRARHADWPDSGSPYEGVIEQGADVFAYLGLRNIECDSAEYGMTWVVPGDGGGTIGGFGDGAVQAGYPTLRLTFMTEEIVGTTTMLDSDLITGAQTHVAGGDAGADGVIEDLVIDYTGGPDGSAEQ